MYYLQEKYKQNIKLQLLENNTETVYKLIIIK